MNITLGENMSNPRIRDPLHNLIVFDETQNIEKILWEVVSSEPFQRLRRIKQLGFSELVYPGATHTRFAHSLGVFHTAKALIKKIPNINDMGGTWPIALAAALVHDVGHGPFSHAFEVVGKELGLELAKHENVSQKLIRDGELTKILNKFTPRFSENVADMIMEEGENTPLRAVVSSQFDADRLDYIRRDRLMTGNENSAIDFTWLLDNLEIREVSDIKDDVEHGKISTFVIGPKAISAAETYVLGLFQIYQSVYFHKATRGVEKFFSQILIRICRLVQDKQARRVGLPGSHPLMQFAKTPGKIETLLDLDDAVVWGALPQLGASQDDLISQFAGRLRHRDLFKCIDIRTDVEKKINPENQRDKKIDKEINGCCARIKTQLQYMVKELTGGTDAPPPLILDEADRTPYKISSNPIEWINVLTEKDEMKDLRQCSDVVSGLRDFKLTRAYFDRDRTEIKDKIDSVIEKET